MKHVIDNDRFDEMQMAMLSELVNGIKENLQSSGLEKEKIIELTGNIAFTVSCIIDSSTIMEFQGKPLKPNLGFFLDEEGVECLVSEYGSWMHEYVFGLLDEMSFESEL